MNDELRTLLANKRNTQTMLDMKRQRVDTLKLAVDSTPDEIIAADIEQEKALEASFQADKAYREAIEKAAKEAA